MHDDILVLFIYPFTSEGSHLFKRALPSYSLLFRPTTHYRLCHMKKKGEVKSTAEEESILHEWRTCIAKHKAPYYAFPVKRQVQALHLFKDFSKKGIWQNMSPKDLLSPFCPAARRWRQVHKIPSRVVKETSSCNKRWKNININI